MILLFYIGTTLPLNASEFLYKDISREENQTITWIALPYAFTSTSTGLSVGAVGIFYGFIQPQMTMVVTAYKGEKTEVNTFNNADKETASAQGLFVAISEFRIPYTQRFYLNFLGMESYSPNQQIYVDGTNDSVRNQDDKSITNLTPFQTQGTSNWWALNLRYILPIGASKVQAIIPITAENGMVINRDHAGGGTPFITGQTIVGIKPFYQRWTADKLQPHGEIATNGLKFYLEHDNTDYPNNPLRGYNFKFTYAQDFGAYNSTQAWQSLEANYAQYIELPHLSGFRHHVIALNAWTAYVPSWQQNTPVTDSYGRETTFDKGQTPVWEGGRLGGWNRMRAYDNNRFNNKAAIYGAVEYRFIPKLFAMTQKELPIPIDWFQGVIFAEAGRVAPQYNAQLLKDLKYDVGFSLRALAATLPVRYEVAVGSEGPSMWVMIEQPF